MYERVKILKGKREGPTSMILAGVHGDETCGVRAFKKLIPILKIDAGKLIIAYGNPRAIKAERRCTGANLNRMFKKDNLLSEKEKGSYEYKRAEFLKKYLNKSDALLDIHACSKPASSAFIICESNALKIAQYIPAKYIVFGFDAVQPGGTDYYMNMIGKIGMCVECGYSKSKSSVVCALKSIMSFLSARGHLSEKTEKYKQPCFLMYKMYIAKTKMFRLAKKYKDFEEIKKGQLIGKDGTEELRADKKGIIMFAEDRPKAGGEAFLLGTKIK